MTNDDEFHDPKITRFPDRKEREALEKQRFARDFKPANDEPMINMPPVVKALCVINIAIFLFTYFFPQIATEDVITALGFIPARYTGHMPFDVAAMTSPFTHIFLHGSWMHLVMNIGMLMAFGTGMEKKLGGKKMLLFFFATGLCGALFHTLFFPTSTMPMVGASGAISGLFGGIVITMYKEGMMGPAYKSLLPLVVIWIGVSIFFGMFGVPGSGDTIAWTTHVGGFIAGLLLCGPVARLKV